MKASVVTVRGGPEVMKYQDMRDPKPGADDVLVRVAGIGINPEDMLERNDNTKDRYRLAAVVSRAATLMCGQILADRVALLIRQKSDVHSNCSKVWRRCALL
jgi:NADPH:quinone reductase-like Zn-dependent oxidoreductase